MAYNFIGLVNDVNRRLNEVELSDSNFTTAKGFYLQVKDAVNASIQDINQLQYEWPFNFVMHEETLTVGTTRYAFPLYAKTIDFDTFRIKGSSTLDVETTKLHVISYEEYLERFANQEYTDDTSLQGTPRYVFRAPGLEYGLVPCPDKEYELIYEYYTTNVELIKSTDVPNIPEMYRHVIVEGAMYHAYMFRSNEQSAVLAKEKFKEGIKAMRSILINRYDYVRSTALNRPQRGNYVYRIKDA